MIRLAAQQSWSRRLELGGHGHSHGQLQVGIGADDERRVAAQLQRHFLHILSRGLQHQLADTGRAGEADRPHAAVAHQGFHGHLRLADYHVEHPRREAGVLCQLGQGQRRKRCFVGRLDHHRAAGRQRRSRLAG
ncbi:hypothetical protein PPS11_01112 [Pseudomonas putida S11]|nr:hypothetical protein PPS11_01112 [Pseudomonas putida S11]